MIEPCGTPHNIVFHVLSASLQPDKTKNYVQDVVYDF